MRKQSIFQKIAERPHDPRTDEDWANLRAITNDLFKPKKPIDDDALFAGRIKQINDILDAVYEEGGHAIIFGERGVGKTSLANIVEKKVTKVISHLQVLPVSCGITDDFWTIWGNAFNDFNMKGKSPVSVFKKSKNPYDVYNALQDLDHSKYHIFIFDEFDRIQDKPTLGLMADLIKHFSNNPINVTVIIVGVGGTLLDLFDNHESIGRCCSQIKMPRMSEAELVEIFDDRFGRISFKLKKSVKEKAVRLSQGLPGYVHLLGQLMLKNAISRKSTLIDTVDFDYALAQVLEKSDYTARQDYLAAIKSPRKDNKYKEVLLACALAKSDEMGFFYAGDVRAPYTKVRGKNMEITNFATNLNNLCSLERGPALIKSGERKKYQYRFANPLVQPLTIMQGVHEGIIDLD